MKEFGASLSKKEKTRKVVSSFMSASFVLAPVVWQPSSYDNSNIQKTGLVTSLDKGSDPTMWLDSDRVILRGSNWLSGHGYKDCPTTAEAFWQTHVADCTVGDKGAGPTESEQKILPQAPDVYHKHLLPTDYMPGNPVDRTGPDTDDSYDSVYVGLEGGNAGVMVREMTLMVHPVLEMPIIKKLGENGLQKRAEILYEPFLEGAVGHDIDTEKAVSLFDAGLRCGKHAVGGDKSGLGKYEVLDEVYAAAVEVWADNPDKESGRLGGDCRIRIAKAANTG